MRTKRSIFLCVLLTAACDSGSTAGLDAALEELIKVPAIGALPAEIDRKPTVANWRSEAARLGEHLPSELLQEGQRRFVDVRLHIDQLGRVVDVVVESSSGSPSVDAAAREVALARRYEPALRGGEPVEVWLEGVRVHWPLLVLDGVPRPDLGWGPGLIDLGEIERFDITRWPEVEEWAGSKVLVVETKRRE